MYPWALQRTYAHRDLTTSRLGLHLLQGYNFRPDALGSARSGGAKTWCNVFRVPMCSSKKFSVVLTQCFCIWAHPTAPVSAREIAEANSLNQNKIILATGEKFWS